jgi:hypothetical protein
VSDLYRKKPVVIEAMVLELNNAIDVSLWCGGEAHFIGPAIPAVFIRTLEGTMRADVGDFIIKGVQGEFYPCKPDIFEATYEPADTTPAKSVGGERMSNERLRANSKAWLPPYEDKATAPESVYGPKIAELVAALRAERAYATSLEADMDALVEAAVAYRATVATVKPGLWTQQDALDAAIVRVKKK